MRSVVVLFVASVSLATAQTEAPRKTVWDGVYSESQATRGSLAFNQNCSRCHSLTAEGRSPLVGDSFWKSFSQKPVGDLLRYVSSNMPNGAPGSLSQNAYEDIVALLLKSNGLPSGNAELGLNTITGVQIVPQDGSAKLPANALARVVGCLARSGTDWVVTNATAPEREERVRAAGEDATRALGSRTMTLKFVLTKLDALINSRVAVSGLLLGVDGADGINVTRVNRVAENCL